MKRYLISVVGLLLAGISTPALADDHVGLFFEPGVTYENLQGSVNYPSPWTSSTGKLEGFGLVAKLGLHVNDILFVALDGRYSRPNYTDNNNNYKATASSDNFGPVVGIQMPYAGLRLWGEYVAVGEVDPGSNNNTQVKFSDGKGYRVGAGIHLFAVSLNLEYQNVKYDHANLEQLGPFNPGTNFNNVDSQSNGWIASVTFPIEL